jgi:uncharacterized phage-associated protein
VSPVHLAQYLANRFGALPGGVTPMKVQKLLYYVKAWGQVEGLDPVEGAFTKWPHGPVNREVYEHFRAEGYTRQPIQPVSLGPEHEPQGRARDFVELIGASYARFTALTLSAMTHREDPWLLTESRAVIAPALMRDYYAQQPFARNLQPFALDGKPYHPVQSDLDRAFTLDMSTREAERATTYASFRAYQQRLEDAGYVPEEDWLSGLMK